MSRDLAHTSYGGSSSPSDGASLFVWKAGCFQLSCFCGCAVGLPVNGTDNEFISSEREEDGYQETISYKPQGQKQITSPSTIDVILKKPATSDAPPESVAVSAKPSNGQQLEGELVENVALVGLFSDWKYTKDKALWLDPAKSWPTDLPALPDDMFRMTKTVKMTSASLSFQIVCPQTDWKWRLYPKHFKPVAWGMHVGKAGVLRASNREKTVVGVGNDSVGDKKNFHIVGCKEGDDVVTIWLDVPVKKVASRPGIWELDRSPEEKLGKRLPKLWYTLEDKHDPAIQARVQFSAGDNKSIESYRYMLEDKS